MSDFPMTPQTWQNGLPLERYVDGMQRHQEATRRRLARIALGPADRQALAQLGQVRYALVMTEDWCGDSMLTVPILAAIVASLPAADLRLFPRGANPDLDAYFQARGITHIPVFTFLDAGFHELGTWVERPQAAHQRLAAWNDAHPEVVAIRNDPSLDPEQRRLRLRPLTAGLLDEMEGWYDAGLQQATVDEIVQLLQARPAAQPAAA